MSSGAGRRIFLGTIRARMLFILGVTLGVLILVTSVSVLVMWRVQSVVNDFIVQDLPRSQRIRTLNHLVEGVALGAQRLSHAQTKADLEESYNQIDALLLRIDITAEGLSRRGVDAETLQITRRLQLVRSEAQLGFQLKGAALDLATELDRVQSQGPESPQYVAQRRRQVELTQTSETLIGDLQETVESVVSLLERYTQGLLTGFDRRKTGVLALGRWAVLLMVLVSLTGGAAIALVQRQLVMQGFSRRLDLISRALARLPTTPEDTRVSVEGSDEIAMMARRLEVLLEKALQIQIIVTTDELTRVNNRRSFFELTAIQRKQASRSRRTDSLLMLDIDLFKSINDTHGHTVGDDVLRAVAQACLGCLRGTDILARIGGEEFAVYCPDTRLDAGRNLADRIRNTIRGLEFESIDRRVTLSIGLVEIPPDADSLTRWIKMADQALYSAKAEGRDCVVVADPVPGS